MRRTNSTIERQNYGAAHLMRQALKYEDFVNACLVDRICQEQRFSQLNNLLPMLYQTCQQTFLAHFEKSKIQELLDESEHASAAASATAGAGQSAQGFSVESFVMNFWDILEADFMGTYIERPLCDVFHQEVAPVPEFFVSYCKAAVSSEYIGRVNMFKAGFVSTTEENWLKFVTEERKNLQFWENKQAYKPKDLDMSVLALVLRVLVVLPIKRDIKHDWHLLETKLAKLQKELGVAPLQRCSWLCTAEDLELRVAQLFDRITEVAGGDCARAVRVLNQVLFTLFNSLVSSKHYDGKDRHLLKLFLERCKGVFQEVLRVRTSVDMSFLLTIFEQSVGERIPKDKYDIRLLANLFGEELLETLQIKVSMQRCKVLQLERVCAPEMASKHCVICISGFLQELDDNKDTWKNVPAWFKHAEVYAYKWTACNAIDIFDKGVFAQKDQSRFKKILNAANVISTG